MSIVHLPGIQSQLGLAALLATACFAWCHGGRAERLGGALLVAGWLITRLAHGMLLVSIDAIPFLSDAIDATGLLFVAIRYSSLWLGPALLFYSGGFAVQVFKFGVLDPPPWSEMTYPQVENLLSYLVLAAVAGGTLAAMRRRRVKPKAAPPPGAVVS